MHSTPKCFNVDMAMKQEGPTIDERGFAARTVKRLEYGIANHLRHARIRITIGTIRHPHVWVTGHQFEPAVTGRVFTTDEVEERTMQVADQLRDEGLVPVVCAYTIASGGPDTVVPRYRRIVIGPDTTPCVVRLRHPRILFPIVERDGREVAGSMISHDADARPKDVDRAQRNATKFLKGEYFRATTACMAADHTPPVELAAVREAIKAMGLEPGRAEALIASGDIAITTGGGRRTYLYGGHRLASFPSNRGRAGNLSDRP